MARNHWIINNSKKDKRYYRTTGVVTMLVGALIMLLNLQRTLYENKISMPSFVIMGLVSTALFLYGACSTTLGIGFCHLRFFASPQQRLDLPEFYDNDNDDNVVKEGTRILIAHRLRNESSHPSV